MHETNEWILQQLNVEKELDKVSLLKRGLYGRRNCSCLKEDILQGYAQGNRSRGRQRDDGDQKSSMNGPR